MLKINGDLKERIAAAGQLHVLQYFDELDDAGQEKLLSQLADILSKEDEFVLTGDFNTFELGALDEMSGVGRVNRLESPTVTFPDGNLCIDNILYSKNAWSFGEINLVTESYSDHYMIFADAKLKK